MTDQFEAYQAAMAKIAGVNRDYAAFHKEIGISQADWATLTQEDRWSTTELRKCTGKLLEIIEAGCTIAQLPVVSLPAQYVAAVIAAVVSPANWMAAAQRAPETYDAVAASGLEGRAEYQPVKYYQMQSMVMAFGGDLRAKINAQAKVKA